MSNRRPTASFTREFFCLFLATTLIAAPVFALPARRSASQPLAMNLPNVRAWLRAWMPSLFLSPYAKGAALQTGTTPNLDSLRNNTPQLPNGYTQGSLPPASYLDPVPVLDPNTMANWNAHFTQLTEPANPSGPIGSLPMQIPDPTASASVINGLSVDLVTRHFNLALPVLGLAGRAGLGLNVALSYSSNVWIGNAYNVDRGFPAPGWRLGFGSLLWVDPPTGNNAYLNSATNTLSVMYLAPDGTRHALKYNSVTDRHESYDSTYLSLNMNTGVMTTANGTQFLFGPQTVSPVTRQYQSYVAQIKDRNGNYLSISYKTLSNQAFVPDYVTDTAGRRIDFEYSNNRLTGIKQMRGATPFYYVRIDYAAVTLDLPQAIPPSPGNEEELPSPGVPVPTYNPPMYNGNQVWLPVRLTYPTGNNLRFAYNNKGIINNVTKWVPTITGQGNERAVAGMTISATSRSEWAENWQGGAAQNYAYQVTTAGGWQVLDPSSRMFTTHVNGMA